MAVNNEQPIDPNRLRMRVKVMEPGKRQIIVSPASRTNINDPVPWEVLSEPVGDENLACKDKEWWDNLPRCPNALYQSNLLAIARLEFLPLPRLL